MSLRLLDSIVLSQSTLLNLIIMFMGCTRDYTDQKSDETFLQIIRIIDFSLRVA